MLLSIDKFPCYSILDNWLDCFGGEEMDDTQERRKIDRTSVDYEVFAVDGCSALCKGRDISLYGIGLLCEKSVPEGAELELSIVIREASVNFQAKGVVRHCTLARDREGRESGHILGVEFTEGHQGGLPFLEAEEHSKHEVSQSVFIDLDVETCYKVLSDVVRFPEWVSGVEKATVKERHPDGRDKKVEFEHNMLIRKVRYTDQFSYDDENCRLSWTSLGGDNLLVSNVGGYTLKPVGPDRTMMTFQANITVAFIPSKRIVNFFSTILIRRELKNFKKYVEKEVKKTAAKSA